MQNYYGRDAEDSELGGGPHLETRPYDSFGEEDPPRDYRALRISTALVVALGLIALGGVWAAFKFLR